MADKKTTKKVNKENKGNGKGEVKELVPTKIGDNDVLIHIQRMSDIKNKEHTECIHIIMHTEVGKATAIPLPKVSLSRHGDGCHTDIEKFYIHDNHAPLHTSAKDANEYLVRICKEVVTKLREIDLKKVDFTIYDVDSTGQPTDDTKGLITPKELVTAATS